jgi:hypothetical protein
MIEKNHPTGRTHCLALCPGESEEGVLKKYLADFPGREIGPHDRVIYIGTCIKGNPGGRAT